MAFRLECTKLEETTTVRVCNVATRKYIVRSVKCIGDDSFLLLRCVFHYRTSQGKGEASPLGLVFQEEEEGIIEKHCVEKSSSFSAVMSSRICLIVNISHLLKYYISDFLQLSVNLFKYQRQCT